MPDETDTDETDEFKDIGKDALLPLLQAVRKVVASDAFQKRLVRRIDQLVDIPYFPDRLEGDAMNQAFDIIQKPAVQALDDWISELKE